jgi:hypothetical protein
MLILPMKTFFTLIVTLVMFESACHCQLLTTFRVSTGLGYAQPFAGKGPKGGGLLFIEPTIQATENSILGLRLEGVLMTRGIGGPRYALVTPKSSVSLSLTIFGQRYLASAGRVQPFLGFGMGLFKMSTETLEGISNPTLNAGHGTTFGFYPRAGIDINHYRISLDYNYVTPSEVRSQGIVYNSYFGLRLGYVFGEALDDSLRR